MTVKDVKATWILDSRGLPTVSVRLTTECGEFVAAVPSGASTGTKEACEMRDGGDAFLGKGVQKAVDNVNKVIGPAIAGMDESDQCAVDAKMRELDGTPNKTKLGANAILAVSQAICRAGAGKAKLPLYTYINQLVNKVSPGTKPCIPHMFFNVINGGKHASNRLACQEIMFSVVKAKNATESIQTASEVFHTLKSNLAKIGETTNVGDEGGFAPMDVTPQKGIDLILKSAEQRKCKDKIGIGFDFAASEFETAAESGKYDFDFKTPASVVAKDKHEILSAAQLVDYYVKLLKDNEQVVSLEDPFSEHDGKSFAALMTKIDAKRCQIVADDLTVTNPTIIQKCVDGKEGNSLLVKMNQIGSVSECIDACHIATSNGWSLMVSHRSGETTDPFVADLAVGLGAAAAKFGAPSRGERVVKYNRLMEIECEGKVPMSDKKFL